MQNAQTYLEIVRNRGERQLELRRVYRNLQNRELFLSAYAKLYANKGALTPGTDPTDTVDGMSLKKIDNIISQLKSGTYQWKPTRRTYRTKKNGKLRPLSVPPWSDKLLQEVLRMVLSAYYEPQFSKMSHGFRPGRGCHTALQSIRRTWKGTKWFIEGDIKGCFDHIDHQKLLDIIGRNIKDERLLKLLREMLEAGYLEDWQYHKTYSGTPQGGVISPLLANIFLNELDNFIEYELIPANTRGKRKSENPAYTHLTQQMHNAQRRGDIAQYKVLKKERRTIPCIDPFDPDYRRLKYVRYADDFLLGVVGSKAEVIEVKQRLGEFLNTLGLTMSEEKTLITHATTERARFLGYDIFMGKCDTRIVNNRRTINGMPTFSVPPEVVNTWQRRYQREGKPYHRTELINNSDYDIITIFNQEFQGLVNYYVMAYDVSTKLDRVKWVYQQALVKTLAAKHKTSATRIYRKYTHQLPNGRKVIAVEIARKEQKSLVAKFGGKPIRFEKNAVIYDRKPQLLRKPNELVKRLLTNRCEVCGSADDINVHHIHKLKDLKRRYAGQKTPPLWVQQMIRLRRKTLVVCAQCHQAIHAGKYDGPKLTTTYWRAE